MILDEIKQKLEEINNKVYYGAVDEAESENIWDYIVFNRKPTKIGENRTGYSDYFQVNVICENFIPENMDDKIIKKMLEIKGMKTAASDIEYRYILKPNTNTVVEMMSITFVKARKCD